ncbi:MAG: SUMF1/EgtB/PvdO family nonheme iron enzyme, partial [Anaerolineae bacterium]|nr:SUMF1/EgtB/PvdO family nonheme iron enzyme [Anaerolineae bacterium]
MPKKYRPFLSLAFILIFLLAACNFPGSGAPTEPPPDAATEPPPDAATEPPTLAPIDLAGPPMEVGSQWDYVLGITLMAVPGGEFLMGHERDDNPVRSVVVPDNWWMRSEATILQYKNCVSAKECSIPLGLISASTDPSFASGSVVNISLKQVPILKGTHSSTYNDLAHVHDPVVDLTAYQAEEFCTYVGGRLPYEYEWEYAARGPESLPYPWGKNGPTKELLNAADSVRETTDVTTYFPQGQSYFGLFGMAGNVWEWMAEKYEPYTVDSPAFNPVDPENDERRSVRSSGYDTAYFETVLAWRHHAKPNDVLPNRGFRCIIEDPLKFAPLCEQELYLGIDPETGLPVPGGGGYT